MNKKEIKTMLEELVRYAYDKPFATIFDAETKPYLTPHRLSKKTDELIANILKQIK